MDQEGPPHFHVRRRLHPTPYRETVDVTTDPARLDRIRALNASVDLEVQEGCTCPAMLVVACPACRPSSREDCEVCHGAGTVQRIDAVAFERARGERQGNLA